MKTHTYAGAFPAFAILLVILLACVEALLAYTTLYTEGEVMQGLYGWVICLNIPILVVAFWKPGVGAWGALILGALLLPWQASQIRNWAQIHEEVIAIVRHVDATEESTGAFPPNLGDYEFQRSWVRKHVSYGLAGGSYRVSYFMDDPGVSYWYDSKGGFGYYPD